MGVIFAFLDFVVIVLFPIIFDANGLRPDMFRFPLLFSVNLCVKSVTSQFKCKRHNENTGKT